jgi:hypothetical protein
MNIVQFDEYCNEKFSLQAREQKIRDQRKRPQIPTATILKSIREMPVLGQTSLLAVDQYARSSEARKWHGSKKADMVVSDTTLPRVLEGVEQGPVMEMPYQVVKELEKEGYWDWKLSTGRKIRAAGITDGSSFGGFWASVLIVAGKSEAVVDLEPYEKRGKELVASRKVLRRATKKLGKGFFDLILADGLYPTEKDFRLCRLKLGSDLLVKTEEEGLSVIQDARSLFFTRKGQVRQGMKRVEGFDSEREIDYETIWAEGFEWQGLAYPMTVAHVREKYRKPIKDRPEEVEFWVLTTFQGLRGEELRELAHGRWRIENGVFKRLNALVESKRYRSHSPKVQEMLLRLWMLGLTLLGAYLFQQGLDLIKQTWKAMKITWRWITQRMRLSLYEFALGP